jgi:tousled-like kinase
MASQHSCESQRSAVKASPSKQDDADELSSPAAKTPQSRAAKEATSPPRGGTDDCSGKARGGSADTDGVTFVKETRAPDGSTSRILAGDPPSPPEQSKQVKPARILLQSTLNFGGSVAHETTQLRKEAVELHTKVEQLKQQLADAATESQHLRFSAAQAEEGRTVEVLRSKRYQDVMRLEMIEAARTLRREARRTQHAQHFELGQLITVPSAVRGSQEMWVEGNRARSIMQRLEDNVTRQREVEAGKKVSAQRVRASTRTSNAADASATGGSDENSNGFAVLDVLLDAEEEAEILKSELAALKLAEAALRAEFEAYEGEKAVFTKEIRRIYDEDASSFAMTTTLGNERYVMLDMLGKGGFSEVWKAFDLHDGRYVALKVHHINRDWTAATKSNYLRHAERELEIQRQLDHPRLTKLYDVFEHNAITFVSVMEFSAGSDLDTRLKRVKTLKEGDARIIMIQIISGLRCLADQEKPVIHYDLKPANIIFHSSLPSCLEVKITDFGLSKVVANQGNAADGSIELTSQGTGTYWYLPPECFDKGAIPKISSKVDIWAAGVIFYQMLYGKKPYADGESQQNILHKNLIVSRARTAVEFPAKPPVSNEAKDVIRRCLNFNASERPDTSALGNDPYFRSAARKRGRATATDLMLPPAPTGAANQYPPTHTNCQRDTWYHHDAHPYT